MVAWRMRIKSVTRFPGCKCAINQVKNDAEYIDASEKMGYLRDNDVALIIDQRLRQQSKRTNPNKHTRAA
jgi:hypothetical protein